jgi:thiol-disulfide isomerase/thioredoxin
MTTSRRNLLAAALAGAGASLAWAQKGGSTAPGDAKAPGLPAIGSPLALPDLTLLDGTRFDAAQAAGKVTVVYWWASWCPFCAVQSPHVEKLWRTARSRGLQVLALSVDTKVENAADYLRKKGYTFPAGMATPEVARILPKPKGLPVIVVRGRDGRVVFAEAGEMFPEDIEGLAKLT